MSTVGLNYRSAPVKLIAAGLVLGLHLAVLGLVLAVPSVQSRIQPPDAADVQMVEISMEPSQAPGSVPAPLSLAALTAEKAPQAKPRLQEPAEAPLETMNESPPPQPVVNTAAAAPEKPPVAASPAEEKAVRAPLKPRKHEHKSEHNKSARKSERNARPEPVLKSAEPASRPTPAGTNVGPPPGAVASAAKALADASSSAPPRSAPSDQPRLIGRVDYLGRRPIPVYPRLSERRGEQGRVIVRVLISAQGSVVSVSVRNSSGYSRLDGAALDAARSAHFKPYTENGIAYAAMADIPFDFVL